MICLAWYCLMAFPLRVSLLGPMIHSHFQYLKPEQLMWQCRNCTWSRQSSSAWTRMTAPFLKTYSNFVRYESVQSLLQKLAGNASMQSALKLYCAFHETTETLAMRWPLDGKNTCEIFVDSISDLSVYCMCWMLGRIFLLVWIFSHAKLQVCKRFDK